MRDLPHTRALRAISMFAPLFLLLLPWSGVLESGADIGWTVAADSPVFFMQAGFLKEHYEIGYPEFQKELPHRGKS